MSKILIHIGLHKTGTTFLQRNYFPKIKDCNYFATTSFFRSLCFRDDIKYHIISREELSGIPWSDEGKLGKKNSHSWMTSFKTAVENLKEIFPEAHIVIVFRRHGDLLISLYKQYVQEGGILAFDDFYQPDGRGVINDEDLSFEKRLRILEENFSKVTVLSFEKFKREGTAYFDLFFQSLNLSRSSEMKSKESNRSISGDKIEMLRKINKYYGKLPLRMRRIQKKARLSPRIIFQSHLSFWSPEDSEELKNVKKQVNLKFEKDWQIISDKAW